jgi:xylan 1,4-beta-xylosidase
MSPNISAPTQGNGDWTKWTNFMTAMVQHFEDRYTQAEVRQWYFEVWNEPSWMYSLGDDGYINLYRNTVNGLLQADPMVRVGGPAGSAGESPGMIQRLIMTSLSTAAPVKVDFLTYHRYSDDYSMPAGEATDVIAFHKMLVNLVNTTTVAGMKFTGELLNDEFGPSYMPHLYRDQEIAASFVAKTIVRLGTDTDTTAPSAYGYWALSDLYEENNMGPSTAYRGTATSQQGNYGMLLKGDPTIPESYDVAKPVFNSFRLLHMMGDQQLVVTGSATGNGVGAGATRSTDGSKIQVLVYNHSDSAASPSTTNVVSLTVNNLPFTGAVRARQYIVDVAHANSYRPWVAMGMPAKPTQAQWVTLRDAAELCYYDTTAQATGGSVTLTFPQNIYGVSLIELTSGG